MAYPFQEQEGLTKEQSEVLRELNSFKLVTETTAWGKIKEKIVSLVEEAQEELLGCAPDTGNEARSILSIRWQQREAMKRELLNFIDSQLTFRDRMIEEIKEQHEYTDHSGDPGNNDQ